MKIHNRCFSVVLLITIALNAHAQVVQRGIVLEYNGREQKTPLGQVEILVQNAGSTVSSADGRFMLNFRTLKAGDKVMVRRIEKVGYELFNRDALDQWIISRHEGENFTIVMCRTEKLKDLRDQYYRVAMQSYDRQMKKDSLKLVALLRESRLQETEYKKRLQELRDEYEERLEHVENYIDRFARIDLSQLSEQEARIIEMVQQGDIDGAVKAYEEMELEQKYEQAVRIKQRTGSAIDSLKKYKANQEAYRDSLQQAIRRRNELKTTKQ